MFKSTVPHIKEFLTKHHELYSGPCKAEYWEENLCYALNKAGFGSDWKPDLNHKSGVDQTTNDGTRISNKGGSIKLDYIDISGSRLTKHKTLEDKLDFLSQKKEDYILCLATKKDEWNKGIKRYYFIVIDSNKLNYHEQEWNKTESGWNCLSEVFSAKIQRSMSDQLWTKFKLGHCEEIYEITIG
jgi:hypothetical protein